MDSESLDKTSSTMCNFEFYPEDNMGLDFYFQTYNKLYICDVLSMTEHSMFPGAYMYRNHPIYKADVIGVVVSVDQNSKCFIYEIDDGTGVIACSCWKMSFSDQFCGDVRQSVKCLPNQLINKFKSIDKSDCFEGYALGSVLHVRGKINVFRNKKQIVATYHDLVKDPNMEVFRLIEMPKLCRMKYDKPFELPWKIRKYLKKVETVVSPKDVNEVKSKLISYLKTSGIMDINVCIVLKLEFIKQYLEDETTDEKRIHIEKILNSLEEDGLLCLKVDNPNSYEVLCRDCDLDKVILKILFTECQKERYFDKGCHYMHVLDMLHKTYQYSHVKKSCVIYCLEKLELQSDVITFTKCHFMPINHLYM